MKSYKDYNRNYIGGSDIAALVLVGIGEDGLESKIMKFGEDGTYMAYVVDEEAEIGNHYEKVAEFESWMKIYDDQELVKEFEADRITVYRAGAMGCIVKLEDREG